MAKEAILRPAGSKMTGDAGRAFLSRLRHPRLVFRGMTAEEYEATVGRGNPILSTKRYSHSSEGTSFSTDPEDAEDYVNFGRDDPRTTGRSTWLVAAWVTPTMYVDRDGYTKSHEPVPAIAAWEMYPEEDQVMIRPVRIYYESVRGRMLGLLQEQNSEMEVAEDPMTSPEELQALVARYATRTPGAPLVRGTVGGPTQTVPTFVHAIHSLPLVLRLAGNPNLNQASFQRLYNAARSATPFQRRQLMQALRDNPAYLMLALENPAIGAWRMETSQR